MNAANQPAPSCGTRSARDFIPTSAPSQLAYLQDASTTVRQYFWGCCNCGMSGAQTHFIEYCPECQQRRCADCAWEVANINRTETIFETTTPLVITHTPDRTFDLPYDAHKICNLVKEGLPISQHQQLRPYSAANTRQENNSSSQLQTIGRRGKRKFSKPREDHTKSFACHFYKKSPEHFNPYVKGGKFLKCLYPDPKELRHIEDHLKSFHMLDFFRCKSCFMMFNEEKDLQCHKHSPMEHFQSSQESIQGMDIGQLRKIQEVISVKKNKGQSDERRWYQIWAILFSGCEDPKSPYSEPQAIESPDRDTTAIMIEIEHQVRLANQTGKVRLDPETRRTVIDIVKQVLDTTLKAPKDHDGNVTTVRELNVFDDMINSGLQTKDQEIRYEDGSMQLHPAKRLRLNTSHTQEQSVAHSTPATSYSMIAASNINLAYNNNENIPSIHPASHQNTEIPAGVFAGWEPTPGIQHEDTYVGGDMAYTTPMYNDPPFQQLVRDPRYSPDLSSSTAAQPQRYKYLDFSTYNTNHDDCCAPFDPSTESLEELLARESQQSHANADFKHHRDTNRGLYGRYEFDWTQ